MKIRTKSQSSKWRSGAIRWIIIVIFTIGFHFAFIILFKPEYLNVFKKKMPLDKGESTSSFRNKPFFVVELPDPPVDKTGKPAIEIDKRESKKDRFSFYNLYEIPDKLQPIEVAGGDERNNKETFVKRVKPKPVYIPWPKYPEWFNGDVEGKVQLSLYINKDGKVDKVRILKGLSHPGLTRIAVSAARNTQFTPGLIDGVPQAMWIELTIGFQPR